jgi:hypothetical protein
MPNGSVVSLRRYPVKSMLGEEIDHVEVSERGLAGDRAFALLNLANGKVISAKYPRKWGRMFQCAAALVGPSVVRITLPDGRVMQTDRDAVDEALSEALGAPVRLISTPPAEASVEYIDVLAPGEPETEFAPATAAPAGTFYDYAPVHLLAPSSLRRFQQLYPAGRFDARRFRPNMLIEPDSVPDGFAESGWVGRTLAIGPQVLVRVIDPAPRCVMTTLPQGDLPHDPGILRTAVEHNRVRVSAFGPDLPCVGVYGTVVRGGLVRLGDRVEVQ